MYDRILLAVDGSDEAERAARRGLALADAFDASVDLLYVVERRTIDLTRTADEERRVRDHGESVLASVESLASNAGVPVDTHLREGVPGDAICEVAADLDASLVVVGRQGRTGLRQRLLGGVAEHVLHHSGAPVLVVPANAPAPSESGAPGHSRVLVPTDGSENAERATPHDAAIARAFDAAVHAVNVVDLQAAGGMFDAGGLDATFVERLEERGREAVDRIADGVAEAAPDRAVEAAVVRAESFEGVASRLVEYVAENDVDLVVVGSHGRSNLRNQLLGSTTASVLRTVDVPVLVVRR